MGKIYCVMGKSSSGKDSIYHQIMEKGVLALKPIIPYTTRPIRAGEMEGQEYHFTDRETLRRLEKTFWYSDEIYSGESGGTT